MLCVWGSGWWIGLQGMGFGFWGLELRVMGLKSRVGFDDFQVWGLGVLGLRV